MHVNKSVRPTLRRQRRHVLVRAPVDLVSVRVHGQNQHHDASHDAPGNWTHRGALDHVQGRHLFVCGKKRRPREGSRVSRRSLKGRLMARMGEQSSISQQGLGSELILRYWNVSYSVSLNSVKLAREMTRRFGQTASSSCENADNTTFQ